MYLFVFIPESLPQLLVKLLNYLVANVHYCSILPKCLSAFYFSGTTDFGELLTSLSIYHIVWIYTLKYRTFTFFPETLKILSEYVRNKPLFQLCL